MALQTRLALLTLVLLPACAERPSGGFACAATYLAGATMLLDQFDGPRRAMSYPPRGMPEMLPIRVAAGPAYRGLVSMPTDSTALITVEGTLPEEGRPGFGVLATGLDGRARGVMLYTGRPVPGAPIIGTVVVGADSIPLVGIQTDVSGLEDPACPFFPDSLGLP